jgi:hypothetical protein
MAEALDQEMQEVTAEPEPNGGGNGSEAAAD